MGYIPQNGWIQCPPYGILWYPDNKIDDGLMLFKKIRDSHGQMKWYSCDHKPAPPPLFKCDNLNSCRTDNPARFTGTHNKYQMNYIPSKPLDHQGHPPDIFAEALHHCLRNSASQLSCLDWWGHHSLSRISLSVIFNPPNSERKNLSTFCMEKI